MPEAAIERSHPNLILPLARIHAPIGLTIGATSQAEIAVSILGQMTQVLRQGDKAEAA